MNNQQLVPYVAKSNNNNNNQKPKRKPRGKKPRGPVNSQRDSRVVQAPVASTKVRRTGDPQISERKKNGDVTVTHREYLQDILGSTAFTVIAIAVNPAIAGSFPWLSAMASLYESYQFDSLEFEFQTESATTATGSVMSAVDYDASDPPPLDKQAFASYTGYVRSAPWANFTQKSTKPNLSKQKSFFTRLGALSANQDIKLYDTGNFFIATQGQADPSTVGELYVKYTVRLMTPQLNNTAVGLSKSSWFRFNTGTTPPTIAAGSSAPLTPTGNATGGVFTLTATSPYNCLLSLPFTATTPGQDTTGSTCIIQNVTSVTSGTSSVYTAELAFLTGQTFVFNQALMTAMSMRVGQYNTLVL